MQFPFIEIYFHLICEKPYLISFEMKEITTYEEEEEEENNTITISGERKPRIKYISYAS